MRAALRLLLFGFLTGAIGVADVSCPDAATALTGYPWWNARALSDREYEEALRAAHMEVLREAATAENEQQLRALLEARGIEFTPRQVGSAFDGYSTVFVIKPSIRHASGRFAKLLEARDRTELGIMARSKGTRAMYQSGLLVLGPRDFAFARATGTPEKLSASDAHELFHYHLARLTRAGKVHAYDWAFLYGWENVPYNNYFHGSEARTHVHTLRVLARQAELIAERLEREPGNERLQQALRDQLGEMAEEKARAARIFEAAADAYAKFRGPEAEVSYQAEGEFRKGDLEEASPEPRHFAIVTVPTGFDELGMPARRVLRVCLGHTKDLPTNDAAAMRAILDRKLDELGKLLTGPRDFYRALPDVPGSGAGTALPSLRTLRDYSGKVRDADLALPPQ